MHGFDINIENLNISLSFAFFNLEIKIILKTDFLFSDIKILLELFQILCGEIKKILIYQDIDSIKEHKLFFFYWLFNT